LVFDFLTISDWLLILNMSHKLSKSTKRRRVLQEIDEILPSFDTVNDELEVEQLMQFNTPDPIDKDSELHSVH